jgi:hypothetical protein
MHVAEKVSQSNYSSLVKLNTTICKGCRFIFAEALLGSVLTGCRLWRMGQRKAFNAALGRICVLAAAQCAL